MPRVLEANRHEKFDREIMNEMGELGFLGATSKATVRGREPRELRAHRPRSRARRQRLPFGAFGAVEPRHVSDTSFGSEDTTSEISAKARDRRMDRLFRADRNRIIGSDPGGMVTRARRADGGFILNGAKMWITNAPLADVFLIWAKDDNNVIRGTCSRRA